MTLQSNVHSFHIPVMGLAFTIDSPVRVAHLGIDSVISIMDDDLIAKIGKYYADKFNFSFEKFNPKDPESRAGIITSYLNLVNKIVHHNFEKFKGDLLEKRAELEEFLAFLPPGSVLKNKLEEFIQSGKENLNELRRILDENFSPGSIDVNIMTKVDKDNFYKGEPLPTKYNDAHAALRGFALSNTQSSVIFSAGMNPRLYGYMEEFDDFFPDEEGNLNKKIVLKVSDYRSAMIQGLFLAKKGLWVSEYRIESGLNCGGHAFATNGLLLGPIVEEFNQQKDKLIEDTFSVLVKSLSNKGRVVPKTAPKVKFSVQGGVGTSEEHFFLLENYALNSVGWGTPFLLVPEATAVDKDTRKLLAAAKEEDLYLSEISPLGVPFNTIKGTTNDFYKNKRIEEGKAGSSCPKKYLALSKAYDNEEGICTASKKFQDIKLKELESKRNEISSDEFDLEFEKITEKSCLCVGLANAAQMDLDIPVKGQKQGVVVCPGPNLAYFSKEVSLKQMVQHIYGKKSIENHENRPHMFIKELKLYMDNLANQLENLLQMTPLQIKKTNEFKENLLSGIEYYKTMFKETSYFKENKSTIFETLDSYESMIINMEVNQPTEV
ncbi:MAG: hypothetical protein Q4G27_10995 [Flavobacteriaceae bacterium]|nr:hypothetical protein [Flavobacteriaceae bacterium]